MGNAKFSMNALLIVVIIFSALMFLFSIQMVNLSARSYENEFYPIEGTKLSVRYSAFLPNGLYEGSQNTGVLKVKGFFGFDWGAAANGNLLYINEYASTPLGVTLSHLVRVDLTTYQKEVFSPNTMLRGKCASGELVCLQDFIMPSNLPETNVLCDLYAFSDDALNPQSSGATVLFLDPETGECLYRVWDEEALTDVFEERYLNRTLQEVME